MNSENLKLAFSKVKEDINFLNNEILDLKILLNKINKKIDDLTNQTENTTIRHLNQTNNPYKTDIPTHYSTVPQEIEGLKRLNFNVSTGNEGVSTDRQTDNKTDRQTDISTEKTIESEIKEVSEILESLDSIKRGIRLKFKHLTPQEMSVFSTIYQLGELEQELTYKIISKHLKLSESSIRDYVQRMINKGIPIKKQKINNKKICLSISLELKKIATLSTIIQLREL